MLIANATYVSHSQSLKVNLSPFRTATFVAAPPALKVRDALLF